MKPRDVKKLGTDELDIEVLQLRRKLFELESQRVTERIQDTSQFGHIKKDIARLLTEKRSREGAKS
ncbi:MAG: 50S ribosomal protein L29 [Phycisphaerae bacterium]|nr:50S ribosomal protein L29 [Phycisphaerae bacterium]|tara:strand:+ start:565 stop:762 length:198 start_codon:yes stop_codon:yes gene_type:complete